MPALWGKWMQSADTDQRFYGHEEISEASEPGSLSKRFMSLAEVS